MTDADHVVLGGTAEPGQWNREPDPATADAIVARCTAVEPRLNDARRIDDRVGLRPTRPEIRVCVEHLPGGTVVAHNGGVVVVAAAYRGQAAEPGAA